MASVLDSVLEAPVVTSFTKVGYAARRRLDDWTDLDSYDLSGRTIAITGPTSGLGLAAARQLARSGARLLLVARNPEKVARVAADLASSGPDADLGTVTADMGDLGSVRSAAEHLAAEERIDVLIHNAGALTAERRETAAGIELTTAVHVVGPFLLTGLLLDRLAATPDARVLTMSSGGMYTAGLSIAGLQMTDDRYKGAEQYARAKRTQVILNEMWAERRPDIRFHALHPGWADTPGVEESLPTFRRIVGPLLRTPEQGIDTLVWLAADDGPPLAHTGAFWHDRRIRPIHKLRSTKRSDTAARRDQLWEAVADLAGWDLG